MTTEEEEKEEKRATLPRVFSYSECGCTGISQESINIVSGLSQYNIYGEEHEISGDDDDQDDYISFWLSMNPCSSSNAELRCLPESRMKPLLKALERNSKLNYYAPVSSTDLHHHTLTNNWASYATLFGKHSKDKKPNHPDDDDAITPTSSSSLISNEKNNETKVTTTIDMLEWEPLEQLRQAQLNFLYGNLTDEREAEAIIARLVKYLVSDDDDGDMEYAARVIQYLDSERPSTVIVSHHGESLMCPPEDHYYRTISPTYALGTSIFGSWWEELISRVDNLLALFPSDGDFHGNGIFHVCRVSYPTATIPEEAVARCNANCDAIVVPSEFHRHAFISSGVDPQLLAVIPVAVNMDYYSPTVFSNRESSGKSSSNKNFVFLSICMSSARKNWKSALHAYFSAFKRSDNVEYILKISSEKKGFNSKYTVSMYSFGWAKKYGVDVEDLPKVTMITKNYDQKKMRALYASANTLVSTSHGEFFGLSFFEAVSMGLSVIAPDWGIFHEYVIPYETGLLIDVPNLIPSDAQHGYSKWASPSVDSLITQMQWMYHHQAQSTAMGLQGRENLLKRQSLSTISAMWIKLFQEKSPQHFNHTKFQ